MIWLYVCMFLGACSLLAGPSEASGQAEPKAKKPISEDNKLLGSDRSEDNRLLGTDRYGDPLPPGALARMGTVRFRHLREVWALTFSPDGKMLASGGLDHAIRLWDVATGREIRRLTWRSFLSRRLRSPLHAGSLAISPNGKYLAAALFYHKEIGLWDLATGAVLHKIPAHPEDVLAVAFSPNGKILAVGSEKGVHLWDMASGRKLAEFDAGYFIKALAFSPDGKTLASGSQHSLDTEPTLLLWDLTTGERIDRFGQCQGSIDRIAFSPDGRMLASNSDNGCFQLWEVASGREKWKVVVDARAGPSGRSLAFSPDGKILATSSYYDAISLWDAATGRRARQLTGNLWDIKAVAFSPDGKVLASGSEDQTIRLWDPSSGREIRPIAAHGDRVERVAFSPDGKLLATGSRDGTARVWDAATGRPLVCFTGHQRHRGFAPTIRFSPDGQTVASVGSDQVIRFWAVTTGKELRQLTGRVTFKERMISAFSEAFSPDATMLAATGHHHTVVLWDLVSGRLVGRLEGLQNSVISVVFSPDGKRLVTGSTDDTVRIWDLTTRKQIREFPGCEGPPQLAISQDGKLLASNEKDGEVCVREFATGREIRRLQISGGILRLAFSPDGRILASAAADDFVSLWEIASGQEISLFPHWKDSFWARLPEEKIAPLRVPRTFVESITFSPDGTKLASAHSDTTAIVWDLTPWRIQMARQAAKRQVDLEAAWKVLAGDDASRAYEAIFQFALVPERAVPFLAQHVRPVALLSPEDRKHHAQLIVNLASPHFRVRVQATQELEKLEDVVLPALRQALRGKPSLEVQRRIEHLLARYEGPTPPPKQLRQLRALQVLERIRTPAGRDLLADLARGASEARLTSEAKESLERLDRWR